MIRPIRLYGDPVLRRTARSVRDFDGELRRLAADLIDTMIDADGLGLAAPQVGVGQRVFVVAGAADPATRAAAANDSPPTTAGPAVAAPETVTTHGPATEPVTAATAPAADGPAQPGDAAGAPAEHGGQRPPPSLEEQRQSAMVFVNPRFEAMRGRQVGIEGCLSLPGLYHEEVARYEALRVRYQDVEGGWHEREVSGRFAVVLQHEADHLDGVLFFDRLEREDRLVFLDEHRSELAQMQRDAKAALREAVRSNAVRAGG